MAKVKKGFDAAEWATSTKARTGGYACTLCVAAKDVQDSVRVIAEMRQSGKTKVSQPQVCEMLKTEFGFVVGHSTMYNHIKHHLGIKW